LAATGLAAFLGHLFPVFFGFRGGKGVATALGVQFGLWWSIGLAVALIWLFVAKVLKISSLSALISMALAPAIVWLLWPYPDSMPVMVGMQLIMTGLLFWRHRSNIEKLVTGTEGRLSGSPDRSDQT
jgi:glycerol-3-phosphate acyltransferase PlsY